jgi:hypothetical protein
LHGADALCAVHGENSALSLLSFFSNAKKPRYTGAFLRWSAIMALMHKAVLAF